MAKLSDDARRLAGKLRKLLDGNPTEEEIHQALKAHPFVFGSTAAGMSSQVVAGALSKFPITPDRVPDFTSALLKLGSTQRAAHSRVTFIEIKKPSARLFVDHGRMSKDLNDAWMESVESLRLVADSFKDFLRRVVKQLDNRSLGAFDHAYLVIAAIGDSGAMTHWFNQVVPLFSCKILIGRRDSLDSEGLMRTRELSASTGGTIEVMTYDSLLEALDQVTDEEDLAHLFLGYNLWW